MSFHDKIKRILNKEKNYDLELSCKNFWCKCRYTIDKHTYEDNKELYSVCKKCRKEMTSINGGYAVNNGQRQYDGERFDSETFDKYHEGELLFNEMPSQRNKK